MASPRGGFSTSPVEALGAIRSDERRCGEEEMYDEVENWKGRNGLDGLFM
jgi:hypothetical protein